MGLGNPPLVGHELPHPGVGPTVVDGEVITHKYNTTSAVGLGNPPLAGHELAHPGVGPTVVEGEVVTHNYY